jgi:hypothetical protein
MMGRTIHSGIIRQTRFDLPMLPEKNGILLITIRNNLNQSRTLRLPL